MQQLLLFSGHTVRELWIYTILILSFRTDRSGCRCRSDCSQRSDCSLIRVYIICHSLCNFWTHYSIVKWCCFNFRIFKAIFSGFQIFRIFMVVLKTWDYGTYHIADQRRLRRACASAQSHQCLRSSHTWSMEVDESFEKWVYGGRKEP